MTTREFTEFATREEARRKWYGEAKAFAESLLRLEKEDALTARLAPLRSEEQAIRERVAGVAAALKG